MRGEPARLWPKDSDKANWIISGLEWHLRLLNEIDDPPSQYGRCIRKDLGSACAVVTEYREQLIEVGQ